MKGWQTMVLPLSLAVVLVMVGGTATAAEVWPCQKDAAKLCKGVKPGEGRILKCVKEHQSEVSEACRNHLRAAEAKRQSQPCAADVEKFCKDVPRGDGRVGKCLKEHESQLSDQCKAARKGQRQEKKAAP